MDATRAFALLLGVLLHAVWFYAPWKLETPVVDVAANHFAGWIFFGIHTFRMQLFFLIAGFFARLVLEKRGLTSFVGNRFRRIAIPFAVGWLILYPLFIMTWIWGKNLSGQNLEVVPPLLAALYLVGSGLAFKERMEGGAFSLLHLWFLAYLLYCYAIAVCCCCLAKCVPQWGGRFRNVMNRCAMLFSRPVMGVLVLGLIHAPMLYLMKGWNGITTPAPQILPMPSVVLAYSFFFGLGWMLHTQAGRLDRVFGSWRAHLSLGLMLSIGLYVSVEHLQVTQVAPVRGLLVNDDLNDWPVLRESLLANAGDSAEINAAHQVWMLFPEGARDYVENKEMLTPDEKTGLVQQLNKILMVESLLSINASTSEAELEAMMGQSSLDAIEKNRAALVASLKGVAPLQAGPSRVLKMAYSFGYSLTTILFVFGIMGGFQSLCRHHSPAWRYVADASYWIYLVHMPLLPAIEIVMFRWDMTAWVKIPLLCGTSLVLLFLSYHYLVRSSFIGKILNGRRYPFFANPFKAVWKKASGSPASNDVACHRSP